MSLFPLQEREKFPGFFKGLPPLPIAQGQHILCLHTAMQMFAASAALNTPSEARDEAMGALAAMVFLSTPTAL